VVRVIPVSVALSISPTALPVGTGTSANYSATGTVSLTGGPTNHDVSVALSSSNTGAVTLGASSVVIPQGQTSATFAVTGHPVTADSSSTIVATVSGGSFTSQLVTVQAARAASVTVSPSSIPGGGVGSGTVTVTLPGSAAGLNVALKSSLPSVAQVPASVTVPSGALTANFSVGTTIVGSDTPVVITATYPFGTSVSTNITVLAAQLQSFTITPNDVVGGDSTQYPTGTITLVNPAPSGGTPVTLTKDPSATGRAYITIPASVTVPAGKTSVTFKITTQAVSRTVATTITANIGGSQNLNASLTLEP